MAKDMYQKRRERKEAKVNNGESLHKTSINWYPGHMAKAKREIKDNVSNIDLFIEVIDARIPISSKIDDFDEYLIKKPRILLVSKYDLCDKKYTDPIIEDYILKGFIIYKANLKEIKKDIIIKWIKNNTKETINHIAVIGAPNTGKSTLINVLAGKTKTNVGNKAGITKNICWLKITNELFLLDTPGILYPKLSLEVGLKLACFGLIKNEILNQEEIAFYIIEKLLKDYLLFLEKRYIISVTKSTPVLNVIDMIALKRGLIKKGQEIDYDKAYNLIIKELQSGVIGNMTFDKK